MKICCVESKKFPAEWINGTIALSANFFEYVSSEDMRWIERQDAETDPSYKQIIPYIVLQNKTLQNAERFLCYPRHGTETRLHGLYSCGIGGHIDEMDKRNTLAETIKAGMTRELTEEIRDFSAESIDLAYKGIICEAESAVGTVHLGVVYLAQCRNGYLPSAAEEIAGAEWKTAEQLALLKKELWSDLAFRLLRG
jgi:predicted NUDIX family phosphoesterase